VAELVRRNQDLKFILLSLDIDAIVQVTKERGVKPLLDARPIDLEVEMRRVTDPRLLRSTPQLRLTMNRITCKRPYDDN
jgi:hypothetical protein